MPRLRDTAPRAQAKHLLVHYFRLLFERAGLPFESDNQVELEEIVDSIIQAAIEP